MTGEESRPMGQASSCAVSYNGPITGRFLIFHDARAISHLHRDNPTETHAGQGSTLSSGGGGSGRWRSVDLEATTENGDKLPRQII